MNNFKLLFAIFFLNFYISTYCQVNKIDTSFESASIKHEYENAYQSNVYNSEIKEFDSIYINNYNLIFSKTDSIFIPSDNNNISENICDSIYNGYKCGLELEKKLSKKFEKNFKRKGKELLLFLDNKDTIKLIDEYDLDFMENILGYTFKNYFEDIAYYLVSMFPYEGQYNLLINKKNGFEKIIIGEPYISPSLKNIVVINCFPAYSVNGLQLINVEKDSLVSEFILSPQFSYNFEKSDTSNIDWGPVSMKWLANNKMILKIKYRISDELIRINDKFVRFERNNSWLLLTIKSL